ncbi:MAG: hypothetical protein ABIL62_06330 [Planctomycetota bacterium]
MKNNSECIACGKEHLSKDEIGLNKKLIHHEVERMMCLTCIAEYFETPVDEMKDMVEVFKRQGCDLFG